MTRQPRPSRASKAKTLAQQQADFTAEGSPPPGKVSTSTPADETGGAKVVRSLNGAGERAAPARPTKGK